MASLDPYMTAEELEEYIPGYIAEGRFDQEGNLKIFPIAKSTEVFMLNKTDWDLFARDTGASLEELSTIEGVTDVARRYYEWSGGRAFFGRDAVANYMIIGSRQLGQEIFSVVNGKVTIQDDKEILRKLWDNLYVPHVQGWFAAYGKFRSDDIKTRDIIALVGSTSGAAYFPNKVNLSDTESYPVESLVMPAPSSRAARPMRSSRVRDGGDQIRRQNGVWGGGFPQMVHRSPAQSGFFHLFRLPAGEEGSQYPGYAERRAGQGGRRFLHGASEKTPAGGHGDAQTYTMYTNKAFQGGTAARAVWKTA